MVWAAPYLPVPEVVALEEWEGATVLLTEALPGRDAIHPRVAQPTSPHWCGPSAGGCAPSTTRSARSGVPSASTSPGPWPTSSERVQTGDIDPCGFHEEHAHLSPAAALVELEASAPADEDLVVCHGDYCPPNMLLEEGRVTGYVDLGELGAADRWWDIAVGAWSVGWNFGEELEPLFYESYGIAPDPARIRFFRLLYDLVS